MISFHTCRIAALNLTELSIVFSARADNAGVISRHRTVHARRCAVRLTVKWILKCAVLFTTEHRSGHLHTLATWLMQSDSSNPTLPVTYLQWKFARNSFSTFSALSSPLHSIPPRMERSRKWRAVDNTRPLSTVRITDQSDHNGTSNHNDPSDQSDHNAHWKQCWLSIVPSVSMQICSTNGFLLPRT